MKKLLLLSTVAAIFSVFNACDDVEEYDSAEASWKFGEACKITYGDYSIPMTDEYWNKIVCYYADMESTDDLVLTFTSDGTIEANDTLIPDSEWSQDGISIDFNIGEDLEFSGSVYVNYILATAENTSMNVLPDTIQSVLTSLLSSYADDIDNATTIDEITVYLDKQ